MPKSPTTHFTFRMASWVSILSWILLLNVSSVHAVEVRVRAAVAVTSVLNDLATAFQRSTGAKALVTYGLAADIRQQVIGGDTPDVVILPEAMMEDLRKQGRLSGSVTGFGKSAVSFVARAGAAYPDIGSVDAMKRTLLSVRSIVYADPAKGGVSGVYFAKVVGRLGLADQLNGKTILVPGAQAAEVVARGEAELGVALASEIIPIAGAHLLGPLPGDFGWAVAYEVGIVSGTASSDTARAFAQFVSGPDAAPVLIAKGFVAP